MEQKKKNKIKLPWYTWFLKINKEKECKEKLFSYYENAKKS